MKVSKAVVLLALASQGSYAARLQQQDQGIFDDAAKILKDNYNWLKNADKSKLYTDLTEKIAEKVTNAVDYIAENYLPAIPIEDDGDLFDYGYTDFYGHHYPGFAPVAPAITSGGDAPIVPGDLPPSNVFVAPDAGEIPPAPRSPPRLERHDAVILGEAPKVDVALERKISAKCQRSSCPSACHDAQTVLPAVIEHTFVDGHVAKGWSCHAVLLAEVGSIALKAEVGHLKCHAAVGMLESFKNRLELGTTRCVGNNGRAQNAAEEKKFSNPFYIPSAYDKLTKQQRKKLHEKGEFAKIAELKAQRVGPAVPGPAPKPAPAPVVKKVKKVKAPKVVVPPMPDHHPVLFRQDAEYHPRPLEEEEFATADRLKTSANSEFDLEDFSYDEPESLESIGRQSTEDFSAEVDQEEETASVFDQAPVPQQQVAAVSISPEERHKRIQEKAYYIWKNTGNTNEFENWLAAEKAVDTEIALESEAPLKSDVQDDKADVSEPAKDESVEDLIADVAAAPAVNILQRNHQKFHRDAQKCGAITDATCHRACMAANAMVPDLVRKNYINAVSNGVKCHKTLKQRAINIYIKESCEVAVQMLGSYMTRLREGRVTCQGSGAQNVSPKNVRFNKFFIGNL